MNESIYLRSNISSQRTSRQPVPIDHNILRAKGAEEQEKECATGHKSLRILDEMATCTLKHGSLYCITRGGQKQLVRACAYHVTGVPDGRTQIFCFRSVPAYVPERVLC